MSRSDKRKRHAKLPGKPALAAMPSVQATERRLTRALTGTIETAVEDNGSSMATRPRSRRVSGDRKSHSRRDATPLCAMRLAERCMYFRQATEIPSGQNHWQPPLLTSGG